MKTTILMMEPKLCDTSAPGAIETYVIGYMKTGRLPVEIFRRLELGAGPEPTSSEEAPAEPMFGTHIKEVMEVLGRGHK